MDLLSGALLLRASLWMVMAYGIAAFVLRLIRPANARWHQAVWMLVLVQGLCLAPCTWYWTFDQSWNRWLVPPVVESTVGEGNGPETLVVASLPDRAAKVVPRRASSVLQPASAQPAASLGDWGVRILWLLWLGGNAGLLLSLFAAYRRFNQQVEQAIPADHHWAEEWQETQARAGVQCDIPMYQHARLGPLLCILLRQGYRLIVPSEHWADLTAGQRQAILRHELSHYQCGDLWVTLLLRLVAMVHWFNPVAWWALRHFEEAREWACDEAAAADRRHVPDYARALVMLSADQRDRALLQSPRGLTAAALGAGDAVSERLRRLLTQSQTREPMVKKIALALLVSVIAIAGLFQVRLQAGAQPPSDLAAETTAELDAQLETLAKQLARSKQSVAQRLAAALQTPAGRVVLRDHLSKLSQADVEAARDNAVPNFIARYFDSANGRLTLKKSAVAFGQQLETTAARFNADIKRMEPALKQVGGQMELKSDLDRLVNRFLGHEGAAPMLYIKAVRERLQPEMMYVQQKLGQVFVMNAAGKFVVRPGRKAEVEEVIKVAEQAHAAQAKFARALADWAKDLAASDDLHKSMKKALNDPLFAAMTLIKTGRRGSKTAVGVRIEKIFAQLEATVVDAADGLTLRPQVRDDVQELIEELTSRRSAKTQLSAAVKNFRERVDSQGKLEQRWRKLLGSDVSFVLLGEDYQVQTVSAGDAVKALLGQILAKQDNGKYRVREDRAEQIRKVVTEMFRSYRDLTRHGRVVEDLAAKIDADAPGGKGLKVALLTLGGKVTVIQHVRQLVDAHRSQAWDQWVSQHIDTSATGDKTVKTGSEKYVEEFVKKVAELRQESANDDF